MSAKPIATLRQILREIRLNLGPSSAIQRGGGQSMQPALTQHILGQYRRHQVTEKQVCKHDKEMSNLAANYASYLTSQRLWLDVHNEYHTKSERSVTETAKIVGFKLPHDPK